MTRFFLAALAAMPCLAGTAAAQSDDAKRFGARSFVEHVSLSPDGTHVAMVQPDEGRGSIVVVADLASGKSRIVLRSSGNPERLRYCRWASATRVVCGIYLIRDIGLKVSFTRMVAVNSDGSDFKLLSSRDNINALAATYSGGEIIDWGPDGSAGSVLMTREYVPEYSTGTHIASKRDGLGVELVDATTLKRKPVEPANADAVDYISDGHGAVRIMGVSGEHESGVNSGLIVYRYRLPGSRDWKPLSKVVRDGSGQFTGFYPYAVDRDANVAYGFDDKGGRTALYSVSLDGNLTRKLILENPRVDVDELVQIGRQRRVVGVSYATDVRTAEFFDPALEKLRVALGKALPGKSIISFVDASADESKLLLFAGSDDHAGTYYVYDKATRQLNEVMPLRPQLDKVKLATVKPISFPAADGTMIPGYLTLPPGSDGKNLPAIVMPHGGPGARDEWGFDWLPQFFAVRGFAVLQPNFRGSAGYGDAWFQKNGFQSWRTAIGDINDGGRWLEKQGIAAPGKLAIFGWSYGGYAALQTSVLDSDLFKAIVAVAPVTDLETLRNESREYTNFTIVDQFIGSGKHVKEGSPAQNVDRIQAPVMLFHGDKDRNVGVGESRLMESKLKGAGKPVQYFEFAGLDHQLEDSKVRAQMLDKSDGFIRAALRLPPRP
jgi:dipeptidyl aminopeptidase/acylaminoacyl peptidase